MVLVTGSSYGLGEATARRVGRCGATVLLAARSAERLEAVSADIEEAGGSAHAYAVDLADPEQVEAFAERVLSDHGHVDIMVSNAGKSIRRSLELSFDRPQDFQRTIDINYMGPVRLMLALLPSMCERGQGHLINVSTLGARMPPGPRWAAYQASKTAFDVFFRSAGIELSAQGITTTSVYMALIHTRMSAPTPIFRYVPGQTPDEAAAVICRAIVKRPRAVAPWWVGPTELATAVSRTSWDLLTAAAYRLSRDTPSALAPVDSSSREGPAASEQKGRREDSSPASASSRGS